MRGLERPQLIVIKHDKTRQLFNHPEKLMGGLYRATEKTSVTSMQLEQLAGDVEDRRYACGESGSV